VSRENVALVLRGLESINAADIEGLLEVADPEIEFIPRRAPVTGSYIGHDGMREFMADNAENLDVFRVTPEEVVDAGDRVVVIGTFVVRGHGSGIEMSFPTATVSTVMDGKIVHFQEYVEREKAIEAAGL
jgi:ketosteroid isomerase-like protein